MRNIFTIFKKEMIVYFTTPIAHIVMLAFLVISGYLFYFYFSFVRVSDMSRVFSNMIILGMFVSPIITMRLLSEEKKAGTYELLRTTPISTYQIVLGKYFASLTVFLFGLFPTFVYVVILGVYGKPDYGTIISGYIGFILTMSAFLSIGIFASSLSQNQMVSGIIGFAIIFLLWFIEVMSGMVGDETIAGILKELSFLDHFTNFLGGLIDIKDVSFFVFWIVLLLVVSTKIIEIRTWKS